MGDGERKGERQDNEQGGAKSKNGLGFCFSPDLIVSGITASLCLFRLFQTPIHPSLCSRGPADPSWDDLAIVVL